MLGQGLVLYYSFTLLAVLLIPRVAGVSVNITVDDTFGNSDGSVIPTYLPANDTIWRVGSPSKQCDSCSIRPSMLNTSQIFDQSWHYAIYDSSVGTPVQASVKRAQVWMIWISTIPDFPDHFQTFQINRHSDRPDPRSELVSHTRPDLSDPLEDGAFGRGLGPVTIRISGHNTHALQTHYGLLGGL